jgi:hypothetical protein
MIVINDDRLIRLVATDPIARDVYTRCSQAGFGTDEFMLQLCLAYSELHRETMQQRCSEATNRLTV